MGSYDIAVLPGDGIGPEVVAAARQVLDRAIARTPGLHLNYQEYPAGAELYLRTGVALPPETFEACKTADAMLYGAMGLPDALLPDGTEVHGEVMFKLRFDLDLYAGIRPIKLYPGIPGPLRNPGRGIDYVVIRENCEGLYTSRGGGTLLRNEVSTDTLVVTRVGTTKVVNAAFKLAQQRNGRLLDGKKVVTCCDKANVLRSYAFFRRVFNDVAEGYLEIGRDYAYVDAMTLYQVLRPDAYDVIVAENMFGDIISDLGAATVGGLGMAPSGDVGDKHGLFQPTHGTAPDIAGKGIANPIATILSGRMMLDWLAERNHDEAAARAAAMIERAVEQVLAEGKVRTPDIGGTSSTGEMTHAVCAAVSGGV